MISERAGGGKTNQDRPGGSDPEWVVPRRRREPGGMVGETISQARRERRNPRASTPSPSNPAVAGSGTSVVGVPVTEVTLK